MYDQLMAHYIAPASLGRWARKWEYPEAVEDFRSERGVVLVHTHPWLVFHTLDQSVKVLQELNVTPRHCGRRTEGSSYSNKRRPLQKAARGGQAHVGLKDKGAGGGRSSASSRAADRLSGCVRARGWPALPPLPPPPALWLLSPVSPIGKT